MDPERRIRFEAVFNFRDLGGYDTAEGRTVRWRRLFRADGLYRMTAADAETVRELGIASVLDLRTENEIGIRGRFPVDKVPVEYHHLPFIDVVPDPDFYPTPVPPDFMAGHYHEILHGGSDHVVGALRVLARPEAYPAVFHCAAGKDRTGILAALVLSLLGVPEEVIAEDYGLSRQAMVELQAFLHEHMPEVAANMDRIPTAMLAEPETMALLLQSLRDQYGSVVDFVASLGITDDEVASLRSNLLD
ncbi:MAG: protein-tyrosine phosphatase [Acidimicrobiaceae bacterium]|jgi:protein-tyrosine phosphatase|nr:protein-tyrosine phosphatase [Acidimicrobiaceae bacterium]